MTYDFFELDLSINVYQTTRRHVQTVISVLTAVSTSNLRQWTKLWIFLKRYGIQKMNIKVRESFKLSLWWTIEFQTEGKE
jgi:hypothetical protein